MGKYIPVLLLALVLAASIALTIPSLEPQPTQTTTKPSETPEIGQPTSPHTIPPGSSAVIASRFNSYDELINFIKKSQAMYQYDTRSGGAPIMTPEAIPTPLPTYTIATKPGVFGETAAVVVKSAVPYSLTNVQVAGVDEADIVKTDGELIYLARGHEVSIVKAYPPTEAEVKNVLKFSKTESITGLYVLINESGKRLIVITSNNYWVVTPLKEVTIQAGSAEPGVKVQPATTPVVTVTRTVTVTLPPVPPKPPKITIPNTTIYIYDVGEDGEATCIYNLTVSGRYVTSRMTGGNVYVITSMPVIMVKDRELILPIVNGVPVNPASIFYFEAAPNYVFTMISAVDALKLQHKEHVFLTGGSSWIYVSTSNIYILSRRYFRYVDFMWEVVKELKPELPDDIGKIIDVVMNSSMLPHSAKISTVAEVIQAWFNSLSSEEREKWMRKFTEVANDVLAGRAMEETVIYRFAIDGLDITAEAEGSVPGYVLDQFSMDEYEGYFRIATTSSTFYVKNNAIMTKRVNNVYVLDMNLSIIGRLEGLATGERIYAARYLGDLMYLVTYRQVDPLFGIDLSDPKNPKVIGYLKIPGYSEYLHPYGSKYLIGIGVETDESGGFSGLKVSLFDISNPRNITEVSKIVVKGVYRTPLFKDHKAFLINYMKKYIAFPVHGRNSGVIVIRIGDGNLTYSGLLAHEDAIRALYIGNYIYSISWNSIRVFDDESLRFITQINLILLM